MVVGLPGDASCKMNHLLIRLCPQQKFYEHIAFLHSSYLYFVVILAVPLVFVGTSVYILRI